MHTPNQSPAFFAEQDRDMQVILDHTLEAFILADLNGIIQAFNKKAEQQILKNMQGSLKKGASIYEHMSPQRGLEFQVLLKKVANGETVEYERRYEQLDGRKAWVEFSLSPVSAQSNVTAVCIKGREITNIKESQMLSHTLFNDGPVAMFVCEKTTLKFLEVNNTAIKQYQYSREEFLVMTAFTIRVPDEHAALLNIMREGTNTWNNNIIGYHRQKNGGLLSVQVALHDIEYMGLEAILIVVTDVTEFVDLQQKLNKAKENKQQLITRATIRAQEKERSTIGCELHDNVNQMLASAKLFLNHALQNPGNTDQLIEKSIDTIQQSIDEIRQLSHQLVPPSLAELGLQHAVEELAERMGFGNLTFKTNGLQIFSDVNICEELKLCIYRIFQEQFSNIAKYAKASEITINVSKDDEVLELHIVDNGIGFDTKSIRKGIGLMNICNRASSFDGKMDIKSVIGAGTTITVKFPLHQNQLSQCA